MTISELMLKSRDEEPVRRLEIFTGSGRRREWLPNEKARIVAESYKVDETVSAVARRYACLHSNCSRGVGPLVSRWWHCRHPNRCLFRRW
jgi:transposase-like protein